MLTEYVVKDPGGQWGRRSVIGTVLNPKDK